MKPSDQAWMAQNEIEAIGIQNVLSELMKVLQSMTPDKQIADRNRVDIPHGMFGLSLKMFFERRSIDDVAYVDALRVVCPAVLQSSKNCIVLDDVHDFVSQLARGHRMGNMRPTLTEIEESKKLLGIQQEIEGELSRNLKEVARLTEKLKMFDASAKRREHALDLKKDYFLDQIFEQRQAIASIEFRYVCRFKSSFQHCFEYQKAEEVLRTALTDTMRKYNREIQCGISVRSMLEYEIKDFKERLIKMEERYVKDVDEVNSRLGYMVNRIELIESMRRECLSKLVMFAQEVPVLRAWFRELEEKVLQAKHEEAQALLDSMKKGKKKKAKKKA